MILEAPVCRGLFELAVSFVRLSVQFAFSVFWGGRAEINNSSVCFSYLKKGHVGCLRLIVYLFVCRSVSL